MALVNFPLPTVVPCQKLNRFYHHCWVRLSLTGNGNRNEQWNCCKISLRCVIQTRVTVQDIQLMIYLMQQHHLQIALTTRCCNMKCSLTAAQRSIIVTCKYSQAMHRYLYDSNGEFCSVAFYFALHFHKPPFGYTSSWYQRCQNFYDVGGSWRWGILGCIVTGWNRTANWQIYCQFVGSLGWWTDERNVRWRFPNTPAAILCWWCQPFLVDARFACGHV